MSLKDVKAAAKDHADKHYPPPLAGLNRQWEDQHDHDMLVASFLAGLRGNVTKATRPSRKGEMMARNKEPAICRTVCGECGNLRTCTLHRFGRWFFRWLCSSCSPKRWGRS